MACTSLTLSTAESGPTLSWACYPAVLRPPSFGSRNPAPGVAFWCGHSRLGLRPSEIFFPTATWPEYPLSRLQGPSVFSPSHLPSCSLVLPLDFWRLRDSWAFALLGSRCLRRSRIFYIASRCSSQFLPYHCRPSGPAAAFPFGVPFVGLSPRPFLHIRLPAGTSLHAPLPPATLHPALCSLVGSWSSVTFDLPFASLVEVSPWFVPGLVRLLIYVGLPSGGVLLVTFPNAP